MPVRFALLEAIVPLVQIRARRLRARASPARSPFSVPTRYIQSSWPYPVLARCVIAFSEWDVPSVPIALRSAVVASRVMQPAMAARCGRKGIVATLLSEIGYLRESVPHGAHGAHGAGIHAVPGCRADSFAAGAAISHGLVLARRARPREPCCDGRGPAVRFSSAERFGHGSGRQTFILDEIVGL